MGVGYNPRIVTDGLVLCLDAANPRSAPTTAIESAVVSSVTGSGPSYNVVYTTNVSAARVGDKVNVEKREAGAGTSSTVLSTYTYEITGLDRSLNQLTLTYESDTASLGDDSPADLPSGGGSSGSPEIAPHDIVSLWIDMKGGNNGTPTNGPTFSSDNGGSLVFDGTNDYVNVPTNDILDIRGDITLTAWAYKTGHTIYPYFINKSSGNSYTQYLLGWSTGSTIPFISMGRSIVLNPSNIGIGLNEWVYYAGTRVGDYLTFYINGKIVSGPTSLPINSAHTSTADIRIGTLGWTGYSWNGKIGPLSIYNKGLTSEQILQNYEATKGRYA